MNMLDTDPAGGEVRLDVPATSVGLSIVVPVYRGADTVGTLVAALAGLEVAGGLETAAPTTRARSAAGSWRSPPCR
jgi:hypothetical protein